MSRVKSGHRAPPSCTQNFFWQSARHAHTAHRWKDFSSDMGQLRTLDETIPDKRLTAITGNFLKKLEKQ